MREDVGRRPWRVVGACLPLLLLAGCPQQPPATPGALPAHASAPAAQASAQASAPAQPTPAQITQQAHHATQVQQLIAQVEAQYNSGVANYRGGRLEAARSDFDLAVDTMLRSGMDLKADAALSDELDHLLNAVNALEMAALKQGTGFSAPVEAAPLDAANEVTFPPDAALTAKVKEELKTTQSDFPLVVNDYVAGFIRYFSSSPAGHAHLLRSLERAGRYRDMISKDLGEAGVPQDLIYLAVAESGFQPQVVNAQSGAGGMWQFMPFRGVYGLTFNAYYDERFDPEKSSKAYARYMKELYNQFGDWYLAMAAYNWGPGNVQRAVMRTGYADFWELYKRNALPTATKNYVPGIIAAAIMAKNPKQYGLESLVPDPPLLSDTVDVDYAVDLRLVADVTDAPLTEIVALNPSLLRMTTPSDAGFDLHLPPGTRDVFQKRIAEIPEEKRTTWRFHVVKPGESLDSIATSLHSRSTEIASTNELASDASIDAGDELVIPVTNLASAAHPLHYTVRTGDTLVTIADRFNVSVDDLRRWNRLSSSRVPAHRSLLVSAPQRVTLAPRARRSISHGAGGHGTGAARKAKSDSSMRHSTRKTASTGKSAAHAGATKPSRRAVARSNQ